MLYSQGNETLITCLNSVEIGQSPGFQETHTHTHFAQNLDKLQQILTNFGHRLK